MIIMTTVINKYFLFGYFIPIKRMEIHYNTGNIIQKHFIMKIVMIEISKCILWIFVKSYYDYCANSLIIE